MAERADRGFHFDGRTAGRRRSPIVSSAVVGLDDRHPERRRRGLFPAGWVAAPPFGSVADAAIVLATATLAGEIFAHGGRRPLLLAALLAPPAGAAGLVAWRRLWSAGIPLKWWLVHAGTAVILAAGYFLVAIGADALFADRPIMESLMGAALVILVFAPLRDWLQGTVNQFLYGARTEPAVVIQRLVDQLAGASDAEGALRGVPETVARTLRLPYVGVKVCDGNSGDAGHPRTVASWGRPEGELRQLPLTFQGRGVGTLLLSRRSAMAELLGADPRLLGSLTKQAGMAVYAATLSEDARQSRLRLASAVEAERRRLRRDLHDGLGPTLATVTMRTDVARKLVVSDAAAADALLAQLRVDAEQAVAEVRRLIYELRPPALDRLGLTRALHEEATRLTSAADRPLAIRIDAPEIDRPLPPMVETAVFRIVTEALTNVVRHAEARCCDVRLAIDNGVEVEVQDDGIGLPSRAPVGVGLTSMRERASELGGECRVTPLPRGTCVWARLPLACA